MPRRLTPSDSTTEPVGVEWSLSARHVVGSVVALATLGLAQPLLDLVGRNAAFLVAHDATPSDVVVLAVGLTLAVPLAVAGVILGIKALHRPSAVALHAVVVVALATALALMMARPMGLAERLPVVLVITVAVAFGVVVALLYRRSDGVRRATMLAAVSAPVVAALFLFASPASALVIRPPTSAHAVSLGPDAPPVVIVVFDELPVATLLQANGEIDERAFPQFARLAEDSLFLRNATTVAQQTSDVIPATLTGRYADLEKLPVYADHPDNLIATLSADMALHVEEPITQLCPPGRCRSATPAAQRYRTLARDLSVVAGHLVLPPALTTGLPPIDQGWRDFRAEAAHGKEAAIADRFWAAREGAPAATFERFVEEIDGRGGPTLHFLHTLLPHHPWLYLPDGRSYTDRREVPGMILGSWTGDPWALRHSYQRHLIQTQLADRLLGRLLDRLRDQGLYDDAVVVVMADHGVTFSPGQTMRGLGLPTAAELTTVPLLVKLPGQTQGAASDDPVELVDVAPTILQAVGVEPPEDIDGRSLIGDAPVRSEQRFDLASGPVFQPGDGDAKSFLVERKESWFPHRGPFPYPYSVAPRSDPRLLDLLDNPLPAAPPPPLDGVAVAFDDPNAWDDVNLDAPRVPRLVEGWWTGPVSAPQPVIAVGVNGRIAAVTVVEDTPERFVRAMIPPDLLREGPNEVTLWVVDGANLVPVTMTGPAGEPGG